MSFFFYFCTMKRDDQIIDELLENAKYLQALDDIKPNAAVPLSEGEREDFLKRLNEKDALIERLQSSLANMKESLDTLKLTFRDLN